MARKSTAFRFSFRRPCSLSNWYYIFNIIMFRPSHHHHNHFHLPFLAVNGLFHLKTASVLSQFRLKTGRSPSLVTNIFHSFKRSGSEKWNKQCFLLTKALRLFHLSLSWKIVLHIIRASTVNTTGYQNIDTYISMFLYMYRFGLSDPQEIWTVYYHRLSRLSPPHQLVHN